MSEALENGQDKPFRVPWDAGSTRVWRRPVPPPVTDRLLGQLLCDPEGKFAVVVDIDVANGMVFLRDGSPERVRVPTSELGKYRLPAAVEWLASGALSEPVSVSAFNINGEPPPTLSGEQVDRDVPEAVAEGDAPQAAAAQPGGGRDEH